MADIRIIVKIFLVDREDNVLLLKRSATDKRRPLEWDIPGGHTDPGETIEQALIRETQEEAGVDISHRALSLGYTESKSYENGPTVHWLFYASRLDEQPVITIGLDEHSEYQWLPIGDALQSIEYNLQRRALSFIAQNKLIQ